MRNPRNVLWPILRKAGIWEGVFQREKKCMSGKCFVDTNILFYAQDRSAGLKHERAAKIVNDLWQSATGVLSTQVLQEFCVAVRRVDRNRAIEDLRQWVRRYSDWEIVVNTSESVLAALSLESRHQISFWDALIVHAAQEGRADVLYTEDLKDGQVFGSVHVVNPLVIA
jgi:predicted nucleic acid-binding protein